MQIHEMLLLRQPPDSKPLPYHPKSRIVIEARTEKFVDSGDLKPATSVTDTATLRAGRYLMICNEPGTTLKACATSSSSVNEPVEFAECLVGSVA